MTANPVLPVNCGSVNGSTPIIAQTNSATLASVVFVTLSTNYARAADVAYPNPEPGVAVTGALTNSAQTILSGTRLALYSCEAAALVNASAASYS